MRQGGAPQGRARAVQPRSSSERRLTQEERTTGARAPPRAPSPPVPTWAPGGGRLLDGARGRRAARQSIPSQPTEGRLGRGTPSYRCAPPSPLRGGGGPGRRHAALAPPRSAGLGEGGGGGERPAGGCMTGARAGPPWRRVSGSKHSFLARKSVNGRFAQAGGQDDERIRRR